VIKKDWKREKFQKTYTEMGGKKEVSNCEINKEQRNYGKGNMQIDHYWEFPWNKKYKVQEL
jgi:hypothetical protein